MQTVFFENPFEHTISGQAGSTSLKAWIWDGFFQLLMLRAEDDPRIDGGLTKRTDEYTSADIQNEILKVMALQICVKLFQLCAQLHL